MRKFKRIFETLSSSPMVRPLRVAKHTLWGVAAAIVAVQAIVFGLILDHVHKNHILLNYIDLCGTNIKARAVGGDATLGQR